MTNVRIQNNSMFLLHFLTVWLLVSNSFLLCFALQARSLSKAANNNATDRNALPQSNGDVFFLSSSALLDLGSAR